MKKKFQVSLFLTLSVFLVLLAGCSDDEQTAEPLAEDTTTADVEEEEETDSTVNEVEEAEPEMPLAPSLPTTLKELENLPSGYTEYIDRLNEDGKKLTDDLTKDLPDISGNPTPEQLDRYYEAILSVFQQDFIGPEELIEKMKFQSIGNPEMEDPRYQFKENLNVMVILDASGSMANMEGNQTRMDAAKTAIKAFVKGLPEDANVGLRIYGQEGTGKNTDKALSCSSSELIYPVSQYNAESFDQALAKSQPAGWTPIELALNEAAKDLSSYKGETNTNILYLVSDGISTCDDNPVTAAKTLYDSDITPIVNVIGFNADSQAQKQLQEIAKATEGSYQNVNNAQGLEDQLKEANKVAENWKRWKVSQEGALGYNRVNNSLDIFGYHAKEFGKWVDERQSVGFTLTYLLQKKEMMSPEAHDYLQQKNKDYHNWIEEEYDRLRDDLKAINEMNYTEAINSLEEKYMNNTSTP